MNREARMSPCPHIEIIEHQTEGREHGSAPHFHDRYEINLITTKFEFSYSVEDKSYIIKDTTLSIFNENEIHSLIMPKNTFFEGYNINFRPQFIQGMILPYPEFTEYFENRPNNFEHCILLNDSQRANLINLFNKMLYYQKNLDVRNYYLKTKVILLEILLAVNDIYSVNSETLVVTNYRYKNHLNKIINYIKNHLSEDLQLDSLAGKFYMSKSYINKIFNESLRMTPHQYIIQCRIMKSREYLKQGMAVKQVCGLVGYDKTSNFINAFKKLMGCTPKQYVLEYRK